MSAQQQVKPGSGGRVCSSEAVITGPLGLGVAMTSGNVSTPLFVSLPQPEFSGTVRARNGGQKPSPPRSVAEAQDLCFPLTLGDVWKEQFHFLFSTG